MEKTKKQSIGNTKVQKDKNQMELSLQVKESDKLAQSLQADSFVQAIDFVQSVKANSTPKLKSSVKTTQSKQNTNLSKREKESKLKTLSLEGAKTEKNALKSASLNERSPKGELFFDNLITVEELAVVFRLAPQTIRNWVALGKLPYVKIGKRNMFLTGSLKKWLNQKEKPLWQ